jgi:hypothetical protein
MTQLLGAKERQSFVAYSFGTYGNIYDTKFDTWSTDRFHDHLVHYLLMNILSIIFRYNQS